MPRVEEVGKVNAKLTLPPSISTAWSLLSIGQSPMTPSETHDVAIMHKIASR